MSEYTERQTQRQDVPIKRARPIEETRYESVVHRDSHGMSGGAIAALVLAAVATAVLFTILIMNSQQSKSEEELAQERAQIAASQQANQQQQQPQQPPVVVMPQPQPGGVPPASEQSPATSAAPTNSELELDVTTRILDDQELRAYPIDVKVAAGTAVLSGHVPTQELKNRADSIARRVKGIQTVINNLVLKAE